MIATACLLASALLIDPPQRIRVKPPAPLRGIACGSGYGYEDWTFWWRTWRGEVLPPAPPLAGAEAEALCAEVLAALEEIAAEGDVSLEASALLAMGRIGRGRPACAERLAPALRSPWPLLRQSAALGLAALQDPGTFDALRTAVRAAPDVYTRSSAAVGVARSGGAAAELVLLQAVVGAPEDGGLAAVAALALAELPEPTSTATAVLDGLLDDSRCADDVRAQAPLALCRMPGGGAAIPRFRERASDPATPVRIRESCVLALGVLAGAGDIATTAALERIAATAREPDTKSLAGFALAALGRIAERAARAGIEPGQRARIETVLQSEVRAPSQPHLFGYAALALARIGRALPPGAAEREWWADEFTAQLMSDRPARERGAAALAIGLLRPRTVDVAEWFSLIERDRSGEISPFLAASLGLLGSATVVPELRALLLARLDARRGDVVFASAAARALAVRGDREAVEPIAASLLRASRLGALRSKLVALAQLRDARAVRPVLAVARNRKLPALERERAIDALGAILYPEAETTGTRLRAWGNFRTRIPALDECLDSDDL